MSKKKKKERIVRTRHNILYCYVSEKNKAWLLEASGDRGLSEFVDNMIDRIRRGHKSVETQKKRQEQATKPDPEAKE